MKGNLHSVGRSEGLNALRPSSSDKYSNEFRNNILVIFICSVTEQHYVNVVYIISLANRPIAFILVKR